MSDDSASARASGSEHRGPGQIGVDEWVARSRRAVACLRQVSLGRCGALYERVPKPALFAGFVVVAALIPRRIESSNDIYYCASATVTLVFALLALGLNVAVGFAGSSTSATSPTTASAPTATRCSRPDKFGIHWQAWLVIPLVVLIAVVLGFLLALPSRRLIGDYLAIVTLFFGQIFFVLATQGYRSRSSV